MDRTEQARQPATSVVALAALVALTVPVFAQETAADVVAAKVRSQNYACVAPVTAERKTGESMPEEPVWVLRCANATYRVTLVPNQAAKVEELD